MDGKHSAKNWLAFLMNAGSLLSIAFLERDLTEVQQSETISQMVISLCGGRQPTEAVPHRDRLLVHACRNA
jgi:hypothetical protein